MTVTATTCQASPGRRSALRRGISRRRAWAARSMVSANRASLAQTSLVRGFAVSNHPRQQGERQHHVAAIPDRGTEQVKEQKKTEEIHCRISAGWASRDPIRSLAIVGILLPGGVSVHTSAMSLIERRASRWTSTRDVASRSMIDPCTSRLWRSGDTPSLPTRSQQGRLACG